MRDLRYKNLYSNREVDFSVKNRFTNPSLRRRRKRKRRIMVIRLMGSVGGNILPVEPFFLNN